jgi:hypothetical protein
VTAARARRNAILVACTLLGALCPTGIAAQSRIRVVDQSGTPVPYARVEVIPGGTLVADSAALVRIARTSLDSVRVRVRRIGFEEFTGWIILASDHAVDVSLVALPSRLEEVNVSARANTVLAKTGFYDRLERVQNGAIVGEFFTPEELEARGSSTVTGFLMASRFVRVTKSGRDYVLLGRSRCGMTILLDGQRVRSMEDAFAGYTSLRNSGSGGDPIDWIVSGYTIAAIEVYPSTANAPYELVRVSGRGSCGIVALWTGARR